MKAIKGLIVLICNYVDPLAVLRSLRSPHNGAGPQLEGEGKRERRLPKQKYCPLNCPACPTKLHSPLRQLQDGGFFFFLKPTELGEKQNKLAQ